MCWACGHIRSVRRPAYQLIWGGGNQRGRQLSKGGHSIWPSSAGLLWGHIFQGVENLCLSGMLPERGVGRDQLGTEGAAVVLLHGFVAKLCLFSTCSL